MCSSDLFPSHDKKLIEIYKTENDPLVARIVELEAMVEKVYRYADNEICKEEARCFTSSRMEALKEIRVHLNSYKIFIFPTSCKYL